MQLEPAIIKISAQNRKKKKKRKRRDKNGMSSSKEWKKKSEQRATIQYRLTFFFSVLSSPLCESSWAVRSVGRSMNDWRHLIYVVRSLLLLLHIYFLIWSMKLIYRVSLGQRWTPFILYANATISLSTFIDCMRLHKKWSRQKESSFIRCQIDRFSIRSQCFNFIHSKIAIFAAIRKTHNVANKTQTHTQVGSLTRLGALFIIHNFILQLNG